MRTIENLSHISKYTQAHLVRCEYLHFAVILKRGKVLAVGRNRIGTRARGSGYSRASIHAERDAVKALGNIAELRGATMLVWRISRTSLLPSKPCSDCVVFLEACMRKYGLAAVKYSDAQVTVM